MALAGLVSGQCLAEDFIDLSSSPLSVNGSIRGAVWSGSRSLDDDGGIGTGAVWAKSELDLGAVGDVRADGWIGGQTREQRESDRSGRLRELYWSQSFGDLDLRVGRQLIIWGRADGINPTDNLTPRDFTLLTPEDTDQRFGNLAANAVYHLGDYAVQFIWMPRFQTSVIPLRPVPGIRYGYEAPTDRDQWAMKLDHTGGQVDWSVSYFDGYDPLPDLAFKEAGPTGILLRLKNSRAQVLGADASASIGPYLLRGEAAWTHVDGDDADFFARKRSQIWLVLGGDRSFSEHFNVNLQYFAQKVLDYRSPDNLDNPLLRGIAWQQAALANQTADFQHGLTYRLAWNWSNNTWQAETSGVYSVTTGANLWRGKINYSINDRWRVGAGFDHLTGPERSLFGTLKDNSVAYGELRFLF